LAEFCTKLHARADALDISEKQKIARMLVQEILVGRDTIVIRHSIPLLKPQPNGNGSSTPPTKTAHRGASTNAADYLLRSGSKFPSAGQHLSAPRIRRLDAQDAPSDAV
jgi:hypothetical protein